MNSMLLVFSVFPSSLLVYTIEKLLASTCVLDDDGMDDDFFFQQMHDDCL